MLKIRFQDNRKSCFLDFLLFTGLIFIVKKYLTHG